MNIKEINALIEKINEIGALSNSVRIIKKGYLPEDILVSEGEMVRIYVNRDEEDVKRYSDNTFSGNVEQTLGYSSKTLWRKGYYIVFLGKFLSTKLMNQFNDLLRNNDYIYSKELRMRSLFGSRNDDMEMIDSKEYEMIVTLILENIDKILHESIGNAGSEVI